HTSILTGEAWVLELLGGHPGRIKYKLGVTMEMFEDLVDILCQNGHTNSRNGVKLEEQ
ncbi:hypothetical protein BV22DRAFT_978203, partial [Leucogyrophana mollusca]